MHLWIEMDQSWHRLQKDVNRNHDSDNEADKVDSNENFSFELGNFYLCKLFLKIFIHFYIFSIFIQIAQSIYSIVTFMEVLK